MTDSKLLAIAAADDRGLDGEVSAHFGRCPAYVMVPVSADGAGPARVVANPFFANHQPGTVPRFLAEQGADVILAGGMGHRAVQMFEQLGIEVATGATGTCRDVLDAYLAGRFAGIVPCNHDHPESCGGHAGRGGKGGHHG